MGYGQPHNIVKEVGTPLTARAMVLRDSQGVTFVLVHLELAFVTMAVKEKLLALLSVHHPDQGINDKNLLVTAQHTHSAPGGYGHYPLYNFTIPGFQTRVLKTITEGAMKAIEGAFATLAPSVLTFGEIEISPDKEVAFNRSLVAFQNNADVPPIKDRELAVDRRMRGIFVRSTEGKLRAMINWFGVHCTSISSDNNRIHHDNKGIAAELFEKNQPGTMAFFLQSAAGDISPNFIFNKKVGRMRGKFEDQYESAAYNGEIQFRESERIQDEQVISGNIECYHSFFDMRVVASVPAHGVGFFKGTLDGPGVPPFLGPLLDSLAQLVGQIKVLKDPARHRAFYEDQAPKAVMLDHRDGSFLGIPFKYFKKLPPLPDATLEFFRKAARANSIETLPWVPAIIPFQLVRIGQVLIVTVPGEITNIASKRLEAKVREEVSSLGITEVIISSYANAYMGYVTTPEEYDLQCYEGGHTIYGRRTLQGIMTASLDLIAQLKGQTSAFESIACFQFPPEELARRSI